MGCRVRESDLLLLAHGELPLGRQLLLWLHRGGCPECRARLQEMRRISFLMAGAIRHPGMPLWSARAARSATAGTLAVRWLLIVMGLLAVFILAEVTVHLTTVQPPGPATRGAAPSDDGCRPGIISDRCR